jgi:hypothetical protein
MKKKTPRGGRDAMKPPTPRLPAVEAAEQALEIRVWGWGAGVLVFGGGELAGVRDGGGCRGD